MSTQAPPKAPSSLVKVSRWSLLTLGIFYGYSRNKWLTTKETKLREIAEEERPAKEAAMKVEKDKRNAEEMAYLGKEVGITPKGAGGGGGSSGKKGANAESDCGCPEFKF